VRLGLKLDTDFAADTSFGLRLGVYATRLNALRGEVRTRAEIGKSNGINFELYQPLDFRGRIFVSPTLGFLRSTTDTYLDGQNVARFRVDRFFAGLDVGISLGAYGEIRAGVQRDRGYVKSVIVTAAPISETVDGAGLKLRIVLDQLDSVSFPKKGWFFAGQLFLADTVAGGDAQYNTVRTGGLWARSFGETTLFFAANADMKAGSRLRPYYDLATAGGFLNLSGLKNGELFGQYSGVARLVGYRRLARINSFLGTGIYAGGSLETGNVWQSTDDIRFSNLRVAGSIFLAADTILGPLYFGAGIADRGRHSFYLSLGRPLN
jgi:NTE family protein